MTHSTLSALLLASPCADALLPLVQRLLPHLQQLAQLLHDFRQQPVTPAATHALELRLHDLLRGVGLDLLAGAFNRLEEGPVPDRLEHDGERYRRRDRSPNTVGTLFGPVRLLRYVYEDLEPGNPCLFPLEKRLGVVAGAATPALAERASWWLAQHPQGSTLDLLARDHGVGWSAETLRNVTAAFAAALETHRPAAQVEQVLAWLRQASDSRGRHRPSLVAGRDGIHLPMRTGQAYKEGATATLTVYDRRGRRLGTVYLGRMPQPGQETLSAQLTALLEEVLRQWPGALPRLAYVTDDGHHPATYFRRVLSRLRHPRTGQRLEWQRVVDFYHAAQYLQHMADALFGKTKKGRKWARRMRRRLQEKDGVKRVLQAATYHQQTRGLKGRRAAEFNTAYAYVRRNGKWMAYWRYRGVGLPIGSGVTEAGCKTVFTQRLKQSGMRWEVSGGQVVVTLRVVLLSGVWESAVARLLASQTFPWPGVKQPSASQTVENAA
jgi:hypothetical protein